ncbi:MAG: CvpA family protein [Eubacteriales bacterium]
MKADVLTVIVLLYIFVIALKGAIRGFYGAVFSTFFLIALVAMTIALSPKTYNVIKDSQNVNAYMEEKAWDIVGEETEEIAAGEDYTLLEFVPIPDELGSAIQNGNPGYVQSDSMQIYLKNSVKTLLVYAAAVFFTLIFSIVVLLILAIILYKLVETPGIRSIDRIMGFLLGLLEGLLGVWVLLALLHLFEFSGPAEYILRYVQASPLLSMLDEYNLIYLAERYAMGLKIWD